MSNKARSSSLGCVFSAGSCGAPSFFPSAQAKAPAVDFHANNNSPAQTTASLSCPGE
jgi:hypothetical protein